VTACDCGPPLALDLMTDWFRCARRKCGHRISGEAMERFAVLLSRS
jgi:hypothetical protein